MSHGSLDGRGGWGRRDTCVSVAGPFADHLKLPQHCWLARPQHKIKSKNKATFQVGLFRHLSGDLPFLSPRPPAISRAARSPSTEKGGERPRASVPGTPGAAKAPL